MVFIVRYLEKNKDILKSETVTEIIKYFKENKNYKFPNFLREELKKGNSVSFRIGEESYYIRVE
jgi:hypothetical protein